MPEIHLIERRGLITPPGNVAGNEYESGYWYINVRTAERLINARIYFYERQNAPPFRGGTIISFRVEERGQYQGRIIFKFRADNNYEGVGGDQSGWGNERRLYGEPCTGGTQRLGNLPHSYYPNSFCLSNRYPGGWSWFGDLSRPHFSNVKEWGFSI